MKGDIHSYCSLGIVDGQAYPDAGRSEEAFISSLKKILADDYFDLVEIGQLPFFSLNETVPTLIRQAHMDFTYCGHSRLFKNRLNINSLVKEERLKAVDELKRGMDEAALFGVREFQFLSLTYDVNFIPEAIDALAESTVELCDYAKDKGLFVTLEIFDHNIGKCSLLGPIDRVSWFLSLIEHSVDNFGFMVDCSHIPMMGESLDENLDPIKDHILHAHMGNTQIRIKEDPAYGDMHPRFGYPNSENDTEYLAAFLRKLVDFGI
jgi:Sugar phosphate isomerases/epimerases